MAQRLLKKVEAADRLGVSLREIERLVQKGLPCKGPAGKRTYPWPEIRTWYTGHIREQERRKLQPDTLAEAERRKATADAEMAEARLAKFRGELIHVDLYRQELADALLRLRTAIQSHPRTREHAEEILRDLAAEGPEPVEVEEVAVA